MLTGPVDTTVDSFIEDYTTEYSDTTGQTYPTFTCTCTYPGIVNIRESNLPVATDFH